jgi:hypothetical protein
MDEYYFYVISLFDKNATKSAVFKASWKPYKLLTG